MLGATRARASGGGRWMGYERKRGKLTEFNALLGAGRLKAFP